MYAQASKYAVTSTLISYHMLPLMALCRSPCEATCAWAAFSPLPCLQAMQADIASRLQDTRPQQSATQPGKVWLRGWDDWKKEQQPAAKQ